MLENKQVNLPNELFTIGDNEIVLEELSEQMESGVGVVPFVGAGLSFDFGFPLWRGFLLRLAEKQRIEYEITALLDGGQFEEAAGQIESAMGPNRFRWYFEKAFDSKRLDGIEIKGAVSMLPYLTLGPIVTTNFDRVLERAFKLFEGKKTVDQKKQLRAVWGQDITETMLESIRQNHPRLLKIHGDVEHAEDRVLTLSEYERHYGTRTSKNVDLDRMLPKALATMLTVRPMLFLGCSLDKDRTVAVVSEITKQTNASLRNFAVLERPKKDAAFETKLRDLGELNIGVVWFPSGQFHLIENILQYLVEKIPPGLRRGEETLSVNLPQPIRTWVGREALTEHVTEGLEPGQLTTLVGPGGSGKTQLAVKVARGVQDLYKDGVAWVDLAPLRDPDAVPNEIAKLLGLREQAKKPPTDALVDYLKDKDMLLVLDNCEHLIEAIRSLALEFLDRASTITLLATSRWQVLEEEQRWRVSSLSVPPQDFAGGAEDLKKYEAAELFLRLGKVDLTPSNVNAVMHITRDLDGIPLAIELAAARLKAATVLELSQQLSEALKVRGEERPGVPDRHQTLEATIRWTYDLLSEPQRELLRSVSTFVGGWPADGARAVHYGSKLSEWEVRGKLEELTSRSVVRIESRRGHARFQLLEMVREFAFERLKEAGDAPAFRDRHLEWVVSLAERGAVELTGPDKEVWLDRFDEEHGNIRAAFDWGVEAGRRTLAMRLAGAIWRFWELHGHFAEGRYRLKLLLTQPGWVTDDALFGKVSSAAGMLAYRQGDMAEARRYHANALEIEAKLDNKPRVAEAHNDLGIALQQQGNFEEALHHYGEAREVFLALHEAAQAALARHKKGSTAHKPANAQETRKQLERSVKDSARQAAIARYNMGNTAYETGDLDKARELLEYAVNDFEKEGMKSEIGFPRTALGMVAMHQSDFPTASHELREAFKSRSGAEGGKSDKRGMGDSLNGLGRLALAQGKFNEAREHLNQAIRLRREVGDLKGLTLTLEAFVLLARAKNDLPHALTLAAANDKLRAEIGIPPRPVDVQALGAVRSTAQDTLDAEVIRQAEAEGFEMSPEDVISYVLREIERGEING